MKKKIILAVVISFMFMGVVSAASMWGEYKGKQIIRLTVDSVPMKVSDAPAVLMDDRTMVPIYLLDQVGVKYEWDGKNQTVDIKKPVPTVSDSIDPALITNQILSYKGGGVTLVEVNGDLTAMTYFSSINGFEQDWGNILNIFYLLTNFNASYSRVIYAIGDNENTIEASTQDIKDHMNGKITDEQMSKIWITSGSIFQNNQTNNQQIDPSPSINDTSNSTIEPSNSSSSNMAACQAIMDRHVQEMQEFERSNSPFSGKTVAKKKELEATQAYELAAAGC